MHNWEKRQKANFSLDSGIPSAAGGEGEACETKSRNVLE
jgi:hypothetical protein